MSSLPKSEFAALEVLMTVAWLAASTSISSVVSRNGARWLTWNVVSWPSTVSSRGPIMPPALFARTSIRGYFSFSCAARVRTWPRSAKSLTKKSAPISFAIASVFCAERPTTTTRSPCRAKVRAADAPMPSLAPVMTIVRSGIEVSLERSVGLVFWNPAPSNSNEPTPEIVPTEPGAARESAGNLGLRCAAARCQRQSSIT